MLKHEVASRTLYRENPLTAGHPVKGAQITILSLEHDGQCLVGESHVEWDEAARRNIAPTAPHYENRSCSEEDAIKILDGKIAKLVADGYVYEVSPDMRLFMQTGEWRFEVYQHTPSGSKT